MNGKTTLQEATVYTVKYVGEARDQPQVSSLVLRQGISLHLEVIDSVRLNG